MYICWVEVSYYLKRPSSKTPTVIFARISYGVGNPVKYYLPEKILPKDWNKSSQRGRESKSFPEYPEFNTRLDNIAATIKTTIRRFVNENNHTPPTPSQLKELLDREIKKVSTKQKHTLVTYFQKVIAESKEGHRLNNRTGKKISDGTLVYYDTALKRIESFEKHVKKPLYLDSIDADFYKTYNVYLAKEQQLALNTIGKQIKTVKMLMNEAAGEGFTSNLAFKSFKAFEEEVDTVYLDESELLEIWKHDLSSDVKLDRVRDVFLLGCYTGLRFSDFSIFNANDIKDGFIEVDMKKTKRPVVIPVHSKVEEILKKYDYVLPKPISNQKMNEYLKDVMCNIKKLKRLESITTTKAGETTTTKFEKWQLVRTHTARRSFATNEYKAGTPTLVIMAITGHKTEKEFLKYIRVTPDEHAKHLKMLWQKQGRG